MSSTEDAVRTSLLGSPTPVFFFFFSNFGSRDLETVGTRPGTTTDEKLDAIFSKFVHLEASRVEPHVTNTFGGFAAGLTEMEQDFSALTARMCRIETGVASASNVSGSFRWILPDSRTK